MEAAFFVFKSLRARNRRSTERARHPDPAWWRVAPKVYRSVAVAFAGVTTTGASEANGNGSPSRPDLLEKSPCPLFRKVGFKARSGWLADQARFQFGQSMAAWVRAAVSFC